MKKFTAIFFAAVIFALIFTSCDDFFSKSFGKPRKYDVSKIDLNAGNVDKWIDLAVGNPELADALTEKIKQELKHAKGKDKAILMDAGVKLAVESSGLGESILSNAADLLGNLTDSDGKDLDEVMTDLIKKIRNDFNSKGGKKAANNITAIVSSDISGTGNGEAPQFGDGYKNTVSPGDVAEAVMVLALAELGNDSIDDWSDLDRLDLKYEQGVGFVVIVGSPSPNQITIAAYLNLILNGGSKFDDNPLTSAFKDAFTS